MAVIACELQLDVCHFDVQQAFCPGRTEGSGFDADATGLWGTVRESSTLESELIRLETSVQVLA